MKKKNIAFNITRVLLAILCLVMAFKDNHIEMWLGLITLLLFDLRENTRKETISK